ncbi:nucleoside permease NupG [gut metagenome]|uniref:Nucleoside permease NupG n=1 Tax=gut metagenome TaxID=749906 RepID=J9GMS9_9ZZZZ
MNNSSLKSRLMVMNFLEFAVWGAYLTSMGRYLGQVGLGSHIGWFYSVQGLVSLFMPGIIGIVADRWIPAQRLLSLCHLLAGLFMGIAAFYGMQVGPNVEMAKLFTFYTLSVAFYMPTLALSNSVAFTALTKVGMDTVKDFPIIRVFGTVGFIVTMWVVDLLGFMDNYNQFFVSGAISWLLAAYALPFPPVPLAMARQSAVWYRPWVWMHSVFSRKEKWRFSSFSPCSWAYPFRLPTVMPTPLLAVLPVNPSMPLPSVCSMPVSLYPSPKSVKPAVFFSSPSS